MAFVDSFRGLPEARKADSIIQLAFEHLENLAIRPSWWNEMPASTQAAFMRRVYSGTSLRPILRTAHMLVDDGISVVNAKAVEVAHNLS